MNTSKQTRASLAVNILRVLIALALLCGIVWYLASGKEFSVEAILGYTPESYLLAALFMLGLYIVKTLLVFPPLMVLQIAVGLYFPTLAAILINILGMAIEQSLGYMLGRFIGFGAVDKLLKKYPKVREIAESGKNSRFVAYILRALNMLPMDVVSMYLGSSKMSFPTYLSGSLAGALFGILAATFIGMSLTDPTSPTFILACALSLTISAVSCIIYRRMNRSKASSEA